MGKVQSMHELVLRPGVTDTQFERTVAEARRLWPAFEGWTWYVMKGDRGARSGQYVFVQEFDSVAYRDRYFPAHGPLPDAVQQALDASSHLWGAVEDDTHPGVYTDYVQFDL